MDNKEFNQTTSETAHEPESSASNTLDTLNRLNAASSNPNLTTGNVLSIIGGILFFITALCHLVYSIQNLVAFFQLISSWYSTFGGTFPHILMFIGYLVATAGFVLTGVAFITKNYNLRIQFMKLSPMLIIGYCLCSAVHNLIYCFSWGAWEYAFWMIFDIVYGLLWAAIAMLVFQIKPELTKKMSLAYIIVPSVMLALCILFGISTIYYGFRNVLLTTIEFAALIITGVIIYMSLNTTVTSNTDTQHLNAESTMNTTDNTCTNASIAGNQASSSATYNPVAAEPEGYTGIVKLILLSIVTFSIYIYIWIYRVATFLSRRTPMALQSSPGVQVVLCLFVPFYIIYWVYKQCKAIEDYKTRTTGLGSDDLSLICLLLCIFGFGIVAYALMQDQINKVVKPSPSPAYDYAPSPSAGVAGSSNNQQSTSTDKTSESSDNVSITEAQIETVKKLKELLDAGILTQEEFDAKKKSVLGL